MFRILHRKIYSLLYYLRYMRELLLDKLQGIDFTAPVSLGDAGISQYKYANYYASTSFSPALTNALNYLKINSADSIIDYGSGKGAVLVKFRKYPFRKIAGIELSFKLVAICNANLKKINIRDIEVIEGDATEFNKIDDYNHFYFANPFTSDIFEIVLRRIAESRKRNPRPVTLIYYHPKSHDTIMGTGDYFNTKTFVDGTRVVKVYKSRN